MSYHISKKTGLSYDEALVKVAEELKKEGFGILTEIDVRETLKKKLDVDFRRYKILGACNPPFAYKALTVEDKIGTMLPCNVVVYEQDSEVHVSAIDAERMLSIVGRDELTDTAAEVRRRLGRVVERASAA